MAINDNKTLSFNITWKQIVTILVVFALCFVAIYANALTIGYIVVTIALCVFFLAVAFDYGVDGRPLAAGPGAGGPSDAPRQDGTPADAPRTPRGRNARTA